jgi:hypothetical protein
MRVAKNVNKDILVNLELIEELDDDLAVYYDRIDKSLWIYDGMSFYGADVGAILDWFKN